MTFIFTKNFIAIIAILVCIEQSNALPYNNASFYVLNKTTTAVPPYNASTISTIAHTPTVSTTVSTMTPTTTAQYTTEKMTLETQSVILSKPTSIAVSHSSPSFTGDSGATIVHRFSTTTATPPSAVPIAAHHQFDGLSFAGGALVAIGLVVLGTFVWKMYVARIERSYWTL